MRRTVKSFSVLCAAVAVAAGLAACGDGGLEGTQSRTAAQADASGPVNGSLTISQWPLYIDPGKHGTVAQFEGDSGVDVKWIEDINDNQEFFAKLQPQLAKGESAGRSLITVSDWLAKQMYDLGYIERLDKAQIPNVEKNLIPALRHPAADHNRDFT